MIWDVFANLNYIVGIFLVIGLVAFKLYTLPQFFYLDNYLDAVNIIDILLIFMTQFEKDEAVVRIKVTKINSLTIAGALNKGFTTLTH